MGDTPIGFNDARNQLMRGTNPPPLKGLDEDNPLGGGSPFDPNSEFSRRNTIPSNRHIGVRSPALDTAGYVADRVGGAIYDFGSDLKQMPGRLLDGVSDFGERVFDAQTGPNGGFVPVLGEAGSTAAETGQNVVKGATQPVKDFGTGAGKYIGATVDTDQPGLAREGLGDMAAAGTRAGLDYATGRAGGSLFRKLTPGPTSPTGLSRQFRRTGDSILPDEAIGGTRPSALGAETPASGVGASGSPSLATGPRSSSGRSPLHAPTDAGGAFDGAPGGYGGGGGGGSANTPRGGAYQPPHNNGVGLTRGNAQNVALDQPLEYPLHPNASPASTPQAAAGTAPTSGGGGSVQPPEMPPNGARPITAGMSSEAQTRYFDALGNSNYTIPRGLSTPVEASGARPVTPLPNGARPITAGMSPEAQTRYFDALDNAPATPQ